MFQAYLITCRVNGRQYVGITSRGVDRRWAEHLFDSRADTKRMAVTRALAKHGPENFTIEAICSASTWDGICAVESLLIVQHGTRAPCGYNVSAGGAGPFGVKRTADQIERSASKHRGLPCHPNTRAAAVRTHKGKPKGAEHRAKISASRIGKPRSAETKAKIAAYWAERRAAGAFKTAEPYGHARKAASARIAKIPMALSTHIARVYRPELTETK